MLTGVMSPEGCISLGTVGGFLPIEAKHEVAASPCEGAGCIAVRHGTVILEALQMLNARLAADAARAASRSQLAAVQVAIFLALGGGWE